MLTLGWFLTLSDVARVSATTTAKRHHPHQSPILVRPRTLASSARAHGFLCPPTGSQKRGHSPAVDVRLCFASACRLGLARSRATLHLRKRTGALAFRGCPVPGHGPTLTVAWDALPLVWPFAVSLLPCF